MGGWKLEIFKMGMYMTFPVGLFWYFNQPEYFEKWVIQTKQQLYPPANKDHRNVRRPHPLCCRFVFPRLMVAFECSLTTVGGRLVFCSKYAYCSLVTFATWCVLPRDSHY